MTEDEATKKFNERMEKLCLSENLTKGKYILDNENNITPITDLRVWGEWMDNPLNALKRVLCRTYISPEIYVSTVFLAMDHNLNFWDDMPDVPLLWETMVFKNHEGGEMERYTTREEAIEGHLRMLDEARTLLAVSNMCKENKKETI